MFKIIYGILTKKRVLPILGVVVVKQFGFWISSCGRQTVDQIVWVSGLPLGPFTLFYLIFFRLTVTLFFLLRHYL
jgi:hypothetical protein